MAVFGVYVVTAIVIFAPLLNNGFAADDYYVMHRVGMEGDVLAAGFFRPLSDITLYVNYLIGGFNAFNYHFTNIFLHGIAAFMMFCICLKVSFFEKLTVDKRYPAFIAGLLFVTYPFHSESVAWVVGRASLLAGLFGIAAMLMAVSTYGIVTRVLFSCIFFFIGLLAYESIFPLPAIVVILLWFNRAGTREIFYWIVAYTLTLFMHFGLRLVFAGVITGNYGNAIFDFHIARLLENAFKISGRLVLPPSDNSTLLTIGFCTMLAAFVWLKIIARKSGIRTYEELPLLFILLISLIVPFTFSVSTRTSEGDRLLYYPSIFICMLAAYMLLRYIHTNVWRIVAISALLIYNISFVQFNNTNWVHASRISDSFINQVKLMPPGKRLFLINVPGEYRGAYVFRGALEHALLVNGLDTVNIRAVNYINHGEMMMTPNPLEPIASAGMVSFGPSVRLVGDTLISTDFREPHLDPVKWLLPPDAALWFWDKTTLRHYLN